MLLSLVVGRKSSDASASPSWWKRSEDVFYVPKTSNFFALVTRANHLRSFRRPRKTAPNSPAKQLLGTRAGRALCIRATYVVILSPGIQSLKLLSLLVPSQVCRESKGGHDLDVQM